MATDFIASDRGGARVLKTVSIRSTWRDDANHVEMGRSRSPRQSGDHPSHEVSDSAPTLGSAIRARRRELGMTQQDLATLVNRGGDDMRQSDVSRLERGQVTLPRSHRLQQIAEALQLPSGDLLARGGWSGAESSFSITSGEDPPTADSPGLPFPDVSGSASLDKQFPGYASGTDSLSARTEQILQRCRQERDMVRRILSGNDGQRRRVARS